MIYSDARAFGTAQNSRKPIGKYLLAESFEGDFLTPNVEFRRAVFRWVSQRSIDPSSIRLVSVNAQNLTAVIETPLASYRLNFDGPDWVVVMSAEEIG